MAIMGNNMVQRRQLNQDIAMEQRQQLNREAVMEPKQPLHQDMVMMEKLTRGTITRRKVRPNQATVTTERDTVVMKKGS